MSFEAVIESGLLGTSVLRISEEHIIFHDLQMDCADITSFGYEAEIQRTGPLQIPLNTRYTFKFIDSSGDEMEFFFYRGNVTAPEEGAELYQEIIDNVWKYFGHRLLNESIAAVASGDGWDLGGINCDHHGVHFTQSGFFGKKHKCSIQWNHVRASIDAGCWLDFRSAIDSDCYLRVKTISYDVHLLGVIFSAIRRDPKILDFLTGKKQFTY